MIWPPPEWSGAGGIAGANQEDRQLAELASPGLLSPNYLHIHLFSRKSRHLGFQLVHLSYQEQ